jgi:hypothetical protein
MSGARRSGDVAASLARVINSAASRKSAQLSQSHGGRLYRRAKSGDVAPLPEGVMDVGRLHWRRSAVNCHGAPARLIGEKRTPCGVNDPCNAGGLSVAGSAIRRTIMIVEGPKLINNPVQWQNNEK